MHKLKIFFYFSVLDKNDNPPKLSGEPYNFTVKETEVIRKKKYVYSTYKFTVQQIRIWKYLSDPDPYISIFLFFYLNNFPGKSLEGIRVRIAVEAAWSLNVYTILPYNNVQCTVHTHEKRINSIEKFF